MIQFGLRQLTAEDYRIDNLYEQQRLMCPNCGLIFDYNFNSEEPGWPELDYDHLIEIDENGDQYMEGGAPREICPRCGLDLSEHVAYAIEISPSDLEFTQLTFFVEDKTHSRVVDAIAKSLGKKLVIRQLGNSSKVEAQFKSVQAQGTVTNAYFLVDGDNNRPKNPKDPNFIQLEKYCMENYLLDFEICGEISNKEPKQICSIILDSVRQQAKGENSFLNLLFSRLLESDITEESLKHVDGSIILKFLLQKLGVNESDFIKKYVAKCHEKLKLETILPSRIVEVIKNA